MPMLRWIILLFVSTRAALLLIGVMTRLMLLKGGGYTGQLWLNIWGVWDTQWYISIAENWYTTQANYHGGASYGFFPLYPGLIRLVAWLTGNTYVAGLLVSNLALLGAAVFLFRLVEDQYDTGTARSAVKFLFLFPTAFIFSGVFSESLFLACMLGAFYAARRQSWFLAGLAGGLAALTRSLGVFILLPLLYEYLRSREFKVREFDNTVFWLLLVPAGLALFGLLNYRLTGDFFAFSHIQQTAWKHELSNPLAILWWGAVHADPIRQFNALFTVTILALVTIGFKRIGFAYWLMAVLLLLLPPLAGKTCLNSLTRYGAVVFPVYILLARLPKDGPRQEAATVFCAVLQGFMMVFWTGGYHLVI